MAVARGERHRAALACRHGLGGVLDQIEQHLHQRIPMDINLGKRRIIGVANIDPVAKTRHRNGAGVFKNGVEILRRAFDRAAVGKRLHPVDQRRDAVDLVPNQLGQVAPRPDMCVEELSRPPDSR